jgi:hypothetical protein
LIKNYIIYLFKENMSTTCTPAEIAEKKRIALERLKARQMQNTTTSCKRPLGISAPAKDQNLQDSKKPKLAAVFTKTIACTCALVDESRFLVTASGYHNKMIDIFKSIPSKRYGKLWVII